MSRGENAIKFDTPRYQSSPSNLLAKIINENAIHNASGIEKQIGHPVPICVFRIEQTTQSFLRYVSSNLFAIPLDNTTMEHVVPSPVSVLHQSLGDVLPFPCSNVFHLITLP